MQLPKHSFSLLLDYVAGLEGGARQRLLSEAQRVASVGDEAQAKQSGGPSGVDDAEGDNSAAEALKLRKRAVQRARKIVRALS